MCPRSIAGVPSSQALLGFLSAAPPSVCVPAIIGALAVWTQNQKRKKTPERSRAEYHKIALRGIRREGSRDAIRWLRMRLV